MNHLEEKIEVAKDRIKELEILIEAWNKICKKEKLDNK
tara:strand:- start:50 stop:163 length:114 start_codon:yes stop_codon:yes gene_type:complete